MELIEKDLGLIKGEILVFGGVYSNLQALESLKLEAERRSISPSNIICTGDILGYCAQPVECVEFICEWGIHSIRGNVEQNILDDIDDCGCNFDEGSRCDLLSKQWYPYVSKQIDEKQKNFIVSLPHFLYFSYAGKRFKVVHGSSAHISEFVFKSTSWDIKNKEFDLNNIDVILAGHCGLPFHDVHEHRLWINAGVIGMPANDGKKDTWFMVMSDMGQQFQCQFINLNYDTQYAHSKMMEQGLPAAYAQTLLSGIWDNCDILPEIEKNLQGHTIDL